MATELQVQANRRNAQLSTGPSTEAGKQVSAINSVKHGLSPGSVCSANGESAYELQQIIHELIEEYRPATRTEVILVERMAMAYHHSKRCLARQTDCFEAVQRVKQVIDPYTGNPRETTSLEESQRLLHRYHKDHDRNFLVTLEELRRCQTLRKASTEAPNQIITPTPEAPLRYNPDKIGFVLEYPLSPDSVPVPSGLPVFEPAPETPK